jgi:K+-transporting ATPase A subunit
MTIETIVASIAPVLVGLAFAEPLGAYVARVWTSEFTGRDLPLAPLERLVRRLFRIDPGVTQGPSSYGLSFLVFSGACFTGLYLALRAPANWVLGPPLMPAMPPDLAFRLAMGGVAGWALDGQSPGAAMAPAAGMPGQMVGLALTSASGLAVASALARAFRGRGDAGEIGDFWADLVRNLTHVVLPVMFATTVVWLLVSDIAELAAQTAALGGSMLARTFAPPLVPAIAVTMTRLAGGVALGRTARSTADGRVLGLVMAAIAAPQALFGQTAEFWTASVQPTTLFHSLVGSAAVGGLGVGVDSLLVMAILAVCLGGMLVGRAPEYLGKRLDGRAIKLTVLATLSLWAVLFAFAVLAAYGPATLDQLVAGRREEVQLSRGYANATVAIALALGRFGAALPIIALAGSVVRQPRRSVTGGAFTTGGLLFGGLLTAVILIATGLRCLPLLAGS